MSYYIFKQLWKILSKSRITSQQKYKPSMTYVQFAALHKDYYFSMHYTIHCGGSLPLQLLTPRTARHPGLNLSHAAMWHLLLVAAVESVLGVGDFVHIRVIGRWMWTTCVCSPECVLVTLEKSYFFYTTFWFARRQSGKNRGVATTFLNARQRWMIALASCGQRL